MKNTALRTILLIAFIDLMAFGLIVPLQASYAERLGLNGRQLGLLISAYALMQFFFNPILGRLSDRFGRRRVLLISIGGSVISHSLLGVADIAHQVPLLFVARILDGMTGANIGTAQAYIADVTDEKERSKGMGLFGAAIGLGFVCGPAIGAALAGIGGTFNGADGSAWPAFGAAFFSLVAFVLIYIFLPESVHRSGATSRALGLFNITRLRQAIGQPLLRELFLLAFLGVGGFVMMETTFVYLCDNHAGLKMRGVALMFTYIGLLLVLVQGGLVHRLVNKVGEPILLAIAPFITAAGLFTLAFVPLMPTTGWAWWLIVFACIPTAFGHGLTGPSMNSLVSKHARSEAQGETLGVVQGISGLARAIAPVIAGELYLVGHGWPYLLSGVMLLMAGVFAIVIAPAQNRALAAQADARADQGDVVGAEPAPSEGSAASTPS